MLTEDRFTALPDGIQEHFRKMEQDIVAVICKHIGDIGKLMTGDLKRLDEMRRIGFNMKAVRKRIEDTLKVSEAEVYGILAKAAADQSLNAKATYDILGVNWTPFENNAQLKLIVGQIAKETCDTFRNISQTTMIGFTDRNGKHLTLKKFYEETIDYAVIQARTGQSGLSAAMRRTVDSMAGNGLTYIDYQSGYRRRLDTSVRQNILGGLSHLTQRQAEIVGLEIGADGYEISWHAGFRPTHDFGGKRFGIKEFEDKIKPLMEEPNCYHRAWPVVMGISPPAYSAEQLTEMNEKQRETKSYQGKDYTQYQASQKQRRFELAIRKNQELANAFELSGDTETAKKARVKAQVLRSEYRQFSLKTGLPTKMERTVAPTPGAA